MANRTIKIYKSYFNEFYVAQTDAVRRKSFQKKTQKTPTQQIERAKKIMNEYFREKENE